MFELFPALCVVALIAITIFFGKKTMRPGPAPKPVDEPKELEIEPDDDEPPKTASQPLFSSAFVNDAEGWDSLQEYHQGEDPCHDDMEHIEVKLEALEPSTEPNPLANELVRGFVVGEILNRKRRT